mgnify:CR=1 FL=1
MSAPEPGRHGQADGLRIALYQYAARDEAMDARLGQLDDAARRAAEEGAHVLITPEMFLSGYSVPADRIRAAAEPADGPGARAVAAIARRHGLAVVYGFPERDGARIHNAAQCIDAAGLTRAHHRKIRLAGPGERMVYAGGRGAEPVFELAGFRLSLLICYDVEFPELVRARALAGAELLVVPTALVTEHPFVAHHMVPTRAFENGIFVAYVNYAGFEGDADYLGESTLSGPEGEDRARADDRESLLIADVERGRIERARATLPYLDDARDLAGPG